MLILSYSSEGILPITEIYEIFIKYGKTDSYKISYKKFKSNQTKSNKTLTEFLIICDTN